MIFHYIIDFRPYNYYDFLYLSENSPLLSLKMSITIGNASINGLHYIALYDIDFIDSIKKLPHTSNARFVMMTSKLNCIHLSSLMLRVE